MSAQLCLVLPLPPPRARRSDPATSHIAAARVREFASGHFSAILAALTAPGATIYELAARTGIDHVAIARRMSELEKLGRVRVQRDPQGREVTRPGRSGRPCRVWERT